MQPDVVNSSASATPTEPSQPVSPTQSQVSSNKKALKKTILIVIVLALIAGAIFGVYYWQHKKVTSLSLQVTNLSSQTALLQKQVTNLQKTTTTKSTSSSPSTSSSIPTTAVNYFTITQWGVRAPYSGSLTLQYSELNGDASTMYLSSAQLAAGGPAVCTSTSNGEAGLLNRYLTTAIISANGVPANETAQQYVNQNSSIPYAKIGNYIYIYWGNSYLTNGSYNGPCNDKTSATQTIAAFSSIIPKLQVVQ